MFKDICLEENSYEVVEFEASNCSIIFMTDLMNKVNHKKAVPKR